MSGPKVLLRRVLHISPTSVVFTPKDGESLDFQTVSQAPTAHRGLLQNNGIMAKVMLSLSPTVAEGIRTREDRLRIWWSVLLGSGLIEADTTSVTVPATMSDRMWPIMDEDAFVKHMAIAEQQLKDEAVQECPFVVPVLSVHRFQQKDHGVKGTLGVIYMPHCRQDLQGWSEGQLAQHPVPEATLGTLLNHLVIGLLAVRSVSRICPPYLSMEDVLVGENGNGDGEPTFMLNATEYQLRQLPDRANRPLSAFPFLAPELVSQTSRSLSHPKYDVWALGMAVYQIACGMPSSFKSNLRLRRQGSECKIELPLNHCLTTPSDTARHVRRSLQPAEYSNPFIHLVLLMLGQDPFTRPTLRGLDRMLHDIFRHKPILRFPFAIGPFDLLRLPNPESVIINDLDRNYVISSYCILCKKKRNKGVCRSGEHMLAACTPLWATDELLPGYPVTGRKQMTYLFPLAGNLDDKEKRRHIEAALWGEEVDTNALLQLLGGFAVTQVSRPTSIVTCEVLLPLPQKVLRKKETCNITTQLSFTAALSWPSQCTEQLQREGRIQRAVPALFGVRNVRWYSWILPGESLTLNGRSWVPAPDGAFVFWFNENLDPSEFDRYFLVCGVQSLTLQAKVACNVLPDRSFNGDTSDGDPLYNSHSDIASLNLTNEERENRSRLQRPANRNAAKRRNANVSDVSIPNAVELRDAAGDDKPVRRRGSNADSQTSKNTTAPLTASPSRKRRAPKKGNPVRMDYVADVSPQKLQECPTNAPKLPSQLPPIMSSTIAPGEENLELQQQFYDKNMQINRKLSEMVEDRRSSLVVDAKNKQKQPPSQVPRKDNDSTLTPPEKMPSTLAVPIPEVETTMPPQSQPEDSRLASTRLAVKVFGRWYPPRWVDAAFQSLTFCIPDTGEHGRLSVPVKVTESLRLATHATEEAFAMAFCANAVPLMQRNHPHCALALPPREATSIIPHHALVFYDKKREVVGLLGLRFAIRSYPNIVLGEFPLSFKTLPPLPTTATLASQLGAMYFSGNAVIEDSPWSVKGLCERDGEGLRHSLEATSNKTFGDSASTSQPLTISGMGLTCVGDPRPQSIKSDDDALPACWLGFDPATQMLMLADVHQELWHPLYFTPN
ncbi:hypothetical protein DQ04_04561040 [Trypanosoma grayi]|uniref:hypothetical protein n=1 Tax=Trypanosoma grayi TaxID=71804 RepID=UPI0004F43D92|nr:hypothetical protein DQ04_04561040 [Trypanosoma grayi]KEG09836.1 hypothetical protein DQ04_04561040 [Trypanosoma grayi]